MRGFIVTRRITVALSNELAQALDHLTAQRGESRSGLVEMLLRENDYVRSTVEALRRDEKTGGGRTDRD